jgi:hypothetical protein
VELSDELTKYLPRIGLSDKARLAWVIRLVNAYRQQKGADWTSGDWDNASLEIAIFAGTASALPGHGGVFRKDGRIERPSSEDMKTILEAAHTMIANAGQRKPITVGPLSINYEMTWSKEAGRFLLREDIEGRWTQKVGYALARLLMGEGHRVERCPVRLPHDAKQCGAFFIKAKRGMYCSTACASREMTRRKRSKGQNQKGERHGRK